MPSQVLIDAIGDEQCLVFAGAGFVQADQVPALRIRPKSLTQPRLVLRDHCSGRLKHVLDAPVILFEADHRCVVEVLLEVQNVADIRPAPTIDGLVLVTDHANVLALRQQPHQLVLASICVLIFVHHHELETPVIRFANLVIDPQQSHRLV